MSWDTYIHVHIEQNDVRPYHEQPLDNSLLWKVRARRICRTNQKLDEEDKNTDEKKGRKREQPPQQHA